MVAPIRYLTSSQALRMSEVRTLAAVRARNLAVSLGGMPRMLYELATGSDAGQDGGASPLNPQGMLGTDLSGPPFGPAIRHTLCVVEGQGPQSNIVGEGPLHTFSEDDEWWHLPMRVYVRPHVAQRGNEPYTRGYLSLLYLLEPGGVGTGTGELYFYSASQIDSFTRQTPTSLSSSSTATATEASGLWVPLVAGINQCQISVRSTSGSPFLSIVRASVNQIVQLEH